MNGPVAHYIDGDQNGRLHLQHGPIDLIIGVDGAISLELDAYFRNHAFALAFRRFRTVLDELVAELPLLRPAAHVGSQLPQGTTAKRMMAAVLPYSATHFITPMAAVAGSVADEVLGAMLAGFPLDQRPQRIYVNNGGDIALHLDPVSEFKVAMAREDGADLGRFAVNWQSRTRGIATSGRSGRSLSMGIADSVTVLAAGAAEADAAASLIANAVDLPGHTAIRRARAIDVVDDSDLGEHLVVTDCGILGPREVETALDKGVAEAERFMARGLIHRAGLFLKDRGRLVADDMPAADFAGPLAVTTLENKRHA